MAKKAEEQKKAPRKGTRIQFLRDLYKSNPAVSNKDALAKLLAKFPESKASIASIVIWKKMLREEGMDIPKGKAGSPGKKPTKKVVVKKAKTPPTE
jgi:hypothetical protein